jgi:hypothetical protein
VLMKTLLGADEKAEVAGRSREDVVKIVKSIALVITGIDAQEGRSLVVEGKPGILEQVIIHDHLIDWRRSTKMPFFASITTDISSAFLMKLIPSTLLPFWA